MRKLLARILSSILIGKKERLCFIRPGSADVFVGDSTVVSTVRRTHCTSTLYVRLFTLLLHVWVVPFDCRRLEYISTLSEVTLLSPLCAGVLYMMFGWSVRNVFVESK